MNAGNGVEESPGAEMLNDENGGGGVCGFDRRVGAF